LSDPDAPIVVAIGGNALQRPGAAADLQADWLAARQVAEHLADLAATGERLVVTHGNGPQVGDMLRRSELAAPEVPPLSLDVAVAATQGMTGYLLARAIGDALAARSAERPVVALVTQTLVAEDDPAFGHPTKPIGGFVDAAQAERRAVERGWHFAHEPARGHRRVVASPRPLAVLELDAIQGLLAAGAVVVAVGGGGIPVARDGACIRGVPAVVDKDLASSLLAREIGARLLVIATDVECVSLDYGSPGQTPLALLTVADAHRYLAAGQFPPGSMGPKVTAGLEFLVAGGARAVITRIDRIVAAARGEAGTEIVTEAPGSGP